MMPLRTELAAVESRLACLSAAGIWTPEQRDENRRLEDTRATIKRILAALPPADALKEELAALNEAIESDRSYVVSCHEHMRSHDFWRQRYAEPESTWRVVRQAHGQNCQRRGEVRRKLAGMAKRRAA